MDTDIRAHMSYVPHSAQKVRNVIDLVRGKSVQEALTILKFTNKAAADPILKVVSSAMSNAEENFGVSRDDLFIYSIYANEAPTRKWRRFGARGRFKPWLRRSSHITVVLREQQ
jgi:large subunit ribosomal protein L22